MIVFISNKKILPIKVHFWMIALKFKKNNKKNLNMQLHGIHNLEKITYKRKASNLNTMKIGIKKKEKFFQLTAKRIPDWF
jgi:hypothetical protein